MFLLAGIIGANAACGQSASTAIDQVSTDKVSVNSQPTAQGGNLHYRNFVLAVDDQIVFNSMSGDLTLAAPDGSDCFILAESGGTSPAFAGGQLFYISGTSGGQLSKISLDGSNQVRVGQTTLKYLISNENRLYAIESDNGLPVSLRPDGTGRQLLIDIQAIALCLADNKLFITGSTNENGLVRLDLNSGEQEVLLNRMISSLNISGDWLYFSDPAENYKLTAWSLTSRSSSLISDFSVDKAFIVSEGFIYFIETASQNRLFRLPVNGSQVLDRQSAELIIDDAVSSFVVTGDYVYYQRPASKRIYRVSSAGSLPLRIS